MSGLMKAIYHGVTKKTSTFAFAIAVGAFGFERGKFKFVQRFRFILVQIFNEFLQQSTLE